MHGEELPALPRLAGQVQGSCLTHGGERGDRMAGGIGIIPEERLA